MVVLVITLISVVIALAGLHLYWGFGGRWPGRNAEELAAMVVGTTRRPMPGFAASSAVAFALSTAAYIVATQLGAPRFGIPDLLWSLSYWGACAVFLLRGSATFVPGVFEYARATPFFNLNRRIYGPLCLAIGAGMALARLA